MSVSQATADGQGQEQPGTGAGQVPGTADVGQGQQDGFWNMFPNVPEESRGELEPHLKGIQGYITKLEQQYAPFKPLIDGGYKPEDLQAVMSFSQQLSQDPVNTVFSLLEGLQQQGAIHADMDLEAVRAAAEGRFEGSDPTGGDLLETGQQVQDGEMPPWAQELKQSQDMLMQYFQQQNATQQQRTQDAMLQRTVGTFRSELEKAGVNVDEIEAFKEDPKAAERWLVANLITHQMDVASAVQGIVGFREASMKGLVEETEETHETQDLTLDRGVPSSPRRPGGKQDAWSQANAAARNDLERSIRASAQGS